jgi:acylphosphatase
MGDLARARIRVTGIVQGVGFRYFVRNSATALGLGGSVRNRPDGSVEVVAEGDRGLVDELIRQLRVGPRYASVEGIDIRWEEPRKDFSGFDYSF